MLRFIRKAYIENKKQMTVIILLSILSSLTAGIGLIMLIPLMSVLEISSSDIGILNFTVSILSDLPNYLRVGLILLIYIFLMMFRTFLTRYMKIYNAKFAQKYIKGIRKRVYIAIINSDWQVYSSQSHSDLLNSFTTEISRISTAIVSLPKFVSLVFLSLTQISIALALNIPLTLFVILSGGVVFYLFKDYFRKSKENGLLVRQANKKYLKELKGQLESIREVKSYGVEEHHTHLMDKVLDEYESIFVRKVEVTSLPNALFSVVSTIMIAVIFYIANVVLKVEFIELFLIVFILSRIWPLFRSFHTQLLNLIASVPSFESIEELLRTFEVEDTESAYRGVPLNVDECIYFKNVSFSYLNSEARILDRVNFKILTNSITAITGRSGVGKSTIVNLIMGLLKPNSGEIYIDGTLLGNSNVKAWRKMIGYIPQDPIILNETIRDNILRFNPGITEDEIIEALKRANAYDFIMELPKGLDAKMGNKGLRFSGGQRQRIVLARVLASKPKVLILDEATSALDSESEMKIQEVLTKLKSSITIIVIAHRESSISSSDHEIVVEQSFVRQRKTNFMTSSESQ